MVFNNYVKHSCKTRQLGQNPPAIEMEIMHDSNRKFLEEYVSSYYKFIPTEEEFRRLFDALKFDTRSLNKIYSGFEYFWDEISLSDDTRFYDYFVEVSDHDKLKGFIKINWLWLKTIMGEEKLNFYITGCSDSRFFL